MTPVKSIRSEWLLLALLVLLAAACAGGTGGGLKDEVVSSENSAQLAERVKAELTYEEVELLKNYVTRLYPDLPAGQLPSGRSIGEMIDAQRAFVSAQNPEALPGEPAAADPDRATPEEGQQLAQQAPDTAKKPSQPDASKPTGSSGQAAVTQPEESKPAPVKEETPPPPPPPTTAVVANGTSIQVRLAQGISTKTDTAGKTFETQLENDLIVDGKLVAPEGSRVTGKILSASKSGKVKGKAQMAITLDSIFVNDEVYAVPSNTLSFEAQSSTGRDAKRIGIATGVGAVIGAIAGGGKGAAIGTAIGAGAGTGVTLATSGEEVEFAVEQLFEFSLQKDVEMKIIR